MAPDQNTFALELAGVVKRFGRHEVLRGVDLAVRPGELFAVMGISGVGKSVSLKHWIGLLTPDQGAVRVEGRDTATFTSADWDAYLKRCGVVFQQAALFDSMTVGENVAFPLREHSGWSEERIRARVDAVLAQVLLAGTAHLLPSELSGGMRKRVGLARGLVMDPDFVFFDEPTTGLDRVTAALIEELILETHREFGYTGVVITHHWELAQRTADRVALLWNGQVQFLGTTAQFAASDDPIVRGFLARDARALGMRS